MKLKVKVIAFLLFIVLAILSVALTTSMLGTGSNKYVIKGKIDGFSGSAILSTYAHLGTYQPVDTVKVINGDFLFSGKLEEPTVAIINFVQPDSPDMIFSSSFWLENAILNYRFDSISKKGIISGSKTNELALKYGNFWSALPPVKTNNDTSNKKDTRKLIELEHFRKVSKIVNDNPASFYMLFAISQYMGSISLIELDQLLSALTVDASKFPTGRKVLEFKSYLENIQLGKIAPEITGIDSSGKTLSLSAVKGNYTLIEFWASWCIPCVQQIPRLKKVYQKFKPKGFEIFAVSIDDSTKYWAQALQTNAPPWQNIIDKKDRAVPVSALYCLRYIPQNILINQKGEIIARNIWDAELDIKLQHLYDGQ